MNLSKFYDDCHLPFHFNEFKLICLIFHNHFECMTITFDLSLILVGFYIMIFSLSMSLRVYDLAHVQHQGNKIWHCVTNIEDIT